MRERIITKDYIVSSSFETRFLLKSTQNKKKCSSQAPILKLQGNTLNVSRTVCYMTKVPIKEL